MSNDIKNYECLVEATTGAAMQNALSKAGDLSNQLKTLTKDIETNYNKKAILSRYDIENFKNTRLDKIKNELTEYLVDEHNPDVCSVKCERCYDGTFLIKLALKPFKNVPSNAYAVGCTMMLELDVSKGNSISNAIDLAYESEFEGNSEESRCRSINDIISPAKITDLTFVFADGTKLSLNNNLKQYVIYQNDKTATVFFYNPKNDLDNGNIINAIKASIGLAEISSLTKVKALKDELEDGIETIPDYSNLLTAITVGNSEMDLKDIGTANEEIGTSALAKYALKETVINSIMADDLENVENLELTDEDLATLDVLDEQDYAAAEGDNAE